MSDSKSILLDADVVIHLSKCDLLVLLHKLYQGRVVILDEVYNEIKGDARVKLDNLINFSWVKIYTPSTQNKQRIILEYAQIKKRYPNIGMGEAYCMSVAKLDDSIIASSNLKDIKTYCLENNIEYITTIEILHFAFEKKLLNESEFDLALSNIISKGSIMPCKSLQEYQVMISRLTK